MRARLRGAALPCSHSCNVRRDIRSFTAAADCDNLFRFRQAFNCRGSSLALLALLACLACLFLVLFISGPIATNASLLQLQPAVGCISSFSTLLLYVTHV